MRYLLSTVMAGVVFLVSSCQSEADKKYEAAIENTNAFIQKWEAITQKTFSIEDWRAFRADMKALYLENKQLGIVKANLSAEQEKEVIQLYAKANAIHSKLALAKMQDDFTARGTNRLVESNSQDEENISLAY